jgi:hypothetical protein
MFHALQSVCRHNADARTIKTALTDWASAYYGEPPDRALAKLNTADPESRTIIYGLNASLYAAGPRATVAAADAAALAGDAAALVTRVRNLKSTETAEPLGPLYPSVS